MTTAARHLHFISCVCVQLDTQAHTHTHTHTHTNASRGNITAGAMAFSAVEEKAVEKFEKQVFSQPVSEDGLGKFERVPSYLSKSYCQAFEHKNNTNTQ